MHKRLTSGADAARDRRSISQHSSSMQATGSEEFRRRWRRRSVRYMTWPMPSASALRGTGTSQAPVHEQWRRSPSKRCFASRSGGWQEPIRDTHTLGGMTLTAAADFARSFAVLIDAHSTPVYGHLVVASNSKPVIDGTSRPSVPSGIAELLVGDGKGRIGRAQWSYLSSVSHVTWYGLRRAVTRAVPCRLRHPVATYGTTSSSVRAQALCGPIALRKAADVRFVLMGRTDDDWRAVCARTQQHELALMQAYQQDNA